MLDSLNGYLTVQIDISGELLFWRTNNGGYTWDNITDTTLLDSVPFGYGAYSSLIFMNTDTGFFGCVNSIYKTVDGGENWYKTQTPVVGVDTIWVGEVMIDNYGATSIYFADEKHGWATCIYAIDAGFGLKTTDGGESWQWFNAAGSTDMWGVHFHDSLIGGIVGRNNFYTTINLTEDNFETVYYYYDRWTFPFPLFATNICYQNDSTIWISGDPSIIFRSKDHGASFYAVDTAYWQGETYTSSSRDIFFFENIGYWTGGGFIKKYDDSVLALPEKNECKIFPNPFSDKVQLQIATKETQEINFALFSSSGVPVYEAQKNLLPGENNIVLSLESIPKGIYILSLNGNTFFANQKIIKL